MCDVEKYLKIYKEIKKLDPEDTLQLVLEAKDDEAKDFFELIGDFLLQQKQKSVIKGNLF
ncbi:hypothetical protein [uncultured Eubacterium sp.]|uniref:hypothetical protein n=1 Tax=uncultured Eubacterium sp. TaxID=165185 RepID=UPI0025ED5DED|nr:hypothetical protein [uncultured Eubacterium sp.]MCI6536792.1 hypothetical protein [Lachnospiraceae bacterium]